MYFMHYSRVFMILVSADLYKSVFSTYYFIKLAFCLSVFWFLVILCLWLLVLLRYVLNRMSS